MNILAFFLQCGTLIILPIATLGIGIWGVRKLDKKYQFASIAGLIGFVFFEFSFAGIMMDPRSNNAGFNEITLIAIGIGFGTFLFVLVFTPIASLIWRIFK